MVTLSPPRVAAAIGGLALSLTAGFGIAAAGPDLGPIINTTCSYPQVMSALDAESPEAAAELNKSPAVQTVIRSFLDAPPEQRQQIADEMQGNPGAQKYVGLIEQVADTCGNY